MIAFVGGFFLDLIMGDPYIFPHPVRWIGRLISAIEKHDLGEEDTKALSGEQKRRCGRRLVLLVCGTTILVTAFCSAFWHMGSILWQDVWWKCF